MTNPLLSDDPLASLLLRPAQGPAVPVRYRSGVLTSWDISNGSNTVLVDGVPLTNLPVLTGSYLSILAEGDTVALISTTDERGITTYAIQGVSLTPPDVRIARASTRLGYQKYVRVAGELSGTTTSATYVALGNTAPADMFKVVADSVVDLTLSGTLYTNGAAAVQLGVQVDGATNINILPINLTNELDVAHTPYSHSILITGLGSGVHSFQPIWLRIGGAGNLNVDGGDVLTMTIREMIFNG
jgi:hypothetical protein